MNFFEPPTGGRFFSDEPSEQIFIFISQRNMLLQIGIVITVLITEMHLFLKRLSVQSTKLWVS